MRPSLSVLAFLIAVLAACDQVQPQPDAVDPPPSVPIPVAPGGPPSARQFVDIDPSPLTAEELIGMWSFDENCARAIVYSADGTYADQAGVSGTWTVEDSRLTTTNGDRTISDRANPLDADTIALVAPGGVAAILMRCKLAR